MLMLAVVMTGLEAAFDRYLRLDPEIWPRVMALKGKVIAIELEKIAPPFYLLIEADQIRVVDHYENEPSVSIRGAWWALLRVWRNGGKGSTDLVIEGDTDVAHQFQAILKDLDIDWEEQLARAVGDAPAYHLGSLWRGLRRWGERTSTALSKNSTEYLQQELRALPSHHAVEQFLTAVDTLREDTDRLAVRVERLRRNSASGDSP